MRRVVSLRITGHTLFKWTSRTPWSPQVLFRVVALLARRKGHKLQRGRWVVSVEDQNHATVLIIENGWVITVLRPGDDIGQRTEWLELAVLLLL